MSCFVGILALYYVPVHQFSQQSTWQWLQQQNQFAGCPWCHSAWVCLWVGNAWKLELYLTEAAMGETKPYIIYIMFLEAWWVLLNHSVLSFKTGLTEIWTRFLFTCTQIVTFINDFKHLVISLDVSITLIITKIKSRVYLNCRF